MAGEDKKLFKQLSDVEQMEQLSPSPAGQAFAMTPESAYGGVSGAISTGGWGSPRNAVVPVIRHKCSRRTLFYLKATLNAAFAPDYDFAKAKPHEFCREPSIAWVQRCIRNNMQTVFGVEEYSSIEPAIWMQINNEIKSPSCDIYSYSPDVESDPFDTEGFLWGFNYFWYNKKLRRILFFRTRAYSASAPFGSDEGFVPDEDDETDHDFDLQMEY